VAALEAAIQSRRVCAANNHLQQMKDVIADRRPQNRHIISLSAWQGSTWRRARAA